MAADKLEWTDLGDDRVLLVASRGEHVAVFEGDDRDTVLEQAVGLLDVLHPPSE